MGTDRLLELRWRPPFPLDLAATARALWQGPGDPQVRLDGQTMARASATPLGAGSMLVEARRDEVFARAWGDGGPWLLETLPELLGVHDEPQRLAPRHRLIADIARRNPGLRLARSGRVFEALLPAIIAQKVTGLEARRSHRQLVRRWGTPAPGPLGLFVPPSAAMLASQPYWRFHELGIEQRRADAIRAAAGAAERLEADAALSAEQLRRRLLGLPGVGPWTAAETLRVALGDPDAVSVGDYHIPNMVCWALAGEPRGDDRRMLELLEPYRGQRARVVLLLEAGGPYAPRHGPRMAPRAIAGI